jgi:hypothetical protein
MNSKSVFSKAEALDYKLSDADGSKIGMPVRAEN